MATEQTASTIVAKIWKKLDTEIATGMVKLEYNRILPCRS
jgi:hypothetical protein